MTFSYLLSPVISFALWMDHLIHSKNEFVILKPTSHADSSLDFRIHRWAKPSFPENFCKFQLFLFCKATFCLTDLVPIPTNHLYPRESLCSCIITSERTTQGSGKGTVSGWPELAGIMLSN